MTYVVATIKATTIKSEDVKNDFREAGLPSPSHPVITQWAIWLSAALHCSEKFSAHRTIANNWPSDGVRLLIRGKDATNENGLLDDLVYIN